MNIKNIIFVISIVFISSCQPEQARWHTAGLKQHSTPGHVVFDALAKNVAHVGDCGPERGLILKTYKDAFISNF